MRVDDVREGEAVVEVQAVEPDGESDHGSPTAVQVSVVSEAETSGAAETSGT